VNHKTLLILASFLGLFLELCFIRWLPAHVFSIAFFSNTVLIASFLGLGLGLLLSRAKISLFDYFPYILAGTVCLVLFLGNVAVNVPTDAKTWIWSSVSGDRITQAASFVKLSITELIAVVFFLTVAVFVPIGQKTGRLMAEFPPLRAYTFNILGSLLGVIGFAFLSFFSVPASVWFLIIGIGAVVLCGSFRQRVIGAALFLAVFIAVAWVEMNMFWSPYYSVITTVDESRSLSVYVNQLFHQRAVNFENDPVAFQKYAFPYQLFKPKKVLIVGAGTGNDVWVAQKLGAERIDAVEIDPLIYRLGKEKHPHSPYDSEKVRVFIDDARSFMHRQGEKYDMVLYGTLDSHASLSVASSIRLDNYVYTREALDEAKKKLTPNGVVVLLFSVPNRWMATRLMETSRSVFGEEETRYVRMDNYLFNLVILGGPGVKDAQNIAPDLARHLLPLPARSAITLPTDDWPYLYLREPGIPKLYSVSLMLLVGMSFAMIFIAAPLKKGRFELAFFLLGCGFLLLETKSVTTFSLLFGSTWLVNAVVFSSILAIALLSNWIVGIKKFSDPRLFFAGLMASIVFLYIVPAGALLHYSFALKVLLAGIFVALPIFFSSFVFAILISDVKDMGVALGANLLGAVMGGFLEYLSMIFGLNALYLLALAFYIAASGTWFVRRHKHQ
jgi:SAM-dependent methyltransferase